MKLQEQQAIFAHNVSTLIIYIFGEGYTCTLGEAHRTPEQAEIYARTGKGIKNSLHIQRLAIDLNLFKRDGTYLKETADYELIGLFWENLHPLNRWGGNFTKNGGPMDDGNHFEMRLSSSM